MMDSPAETAEDTTKMGLDWRENIRSVAPEYVSEWDEFKNADSSDKFFDQLKNHRSMLGQSVRIPGEDAGTEQMNEFYNKVQTKVPGLMRTPDPDNPDQVRDVFAKLGLPDQADGYSVEDDTGIDPEALGSYRAMAHEAGLTKAQFNAFISKISEKTKLSVEQATGAQSEDMAGLRGEWGMAFEQRAGICAKVAARTGAPEALCQAVQKGEADSKTMRWLYSLSQQMGGEGVNFLGDEPAAPSTADVQAQIDDIMGNVNHPYWDSSHPSHKNAVDKMLDLQRKLNA